MNYLDGCYKAYRESKRRCRPTSQANGPWKEPFRWDGKQYLNEVFEIEQAPKMDMEFAHLKEAVQKVIGGRSGLDAQQVAAEIWDSIDANIPRAEAYPEEMA